MSQIPNSINSEVIPWGNREGEGPDHPSGCACGLCRQENPDADEPDDNGDRNAKELGNLVIYANKILNKLNPETINPNWGIFNDIEGQLSQMSNILRGIHDALLSAPVQQNHEPSRAASDDVAKPDQDSTRSGA